MTKWRFSPESVADIDDIRDYTLREWGTDQAETYLNAVETRIIFAADHPSLRIRFGDTPRGHFRVKAGTHFVFYKIVDDELVVIRILHERMNFAAHLQ